MVHECLFLLFILVSCAATSTSSGATDPRNITNGNVISAASAGYFDQPQIVVCPDNTWVAVMTANQNGTEGQPFEHLSSSRSADNGTTWSPLLNIEPPSTIDASYACTLITPKGRIYTIYTYNADNITSFPNGQRIPRTDEIGHFKLKYSDDCGQSWSTDRWEVPVPETPIDYKNNWNGTVKLFWAVGKPQIVGESVYFPFTKIGEYMQGPPCQVYFLKSDNLLNATDPSTITWTLYPEAIGVQAPTGDIAEEPHILALDSPDQLWVTYRTDQGFLGGGYSQNAGVNWTSMWITYEGGPYGRPLKNPRGPITPAKFSNGYFLMLFFNNVPTEVWAGRNPYWLTGGRIVNGSITSIEWTQPEIVLYSTGSSGFAGYPDFVENDGKYYMTETQKGGIVSFVRVSQIAPSLVAALWGQWDVNQFAAGYVLDLVAPPPGSKVATPSLPALSTGGGFSILMWIAISPSFPKNETILDTRNASGQAGVLITTGGLQTPSVGITIGDGTYATTLYTDSACSAVFIDAQPHHVGFIVDGGPKVISVVVDGTLCDGGVESGQGWAFFNLYTGSVLGGGNTVIGDAVKVQNVKIYDRYLFTSEVIGNWRAGIQ